MSLDIFVKSVVKVIAEYFPEVTGKHYPIKGRVVKVHPGSKVDIQPLKADGSEDETIQVIPLLPHSPSIVANIGDQVRLSFYYADLGQPFIDEYGVS